MILHVEVPDHTGPANCFLSGPHVIDSITSYGRERIQFIGLYIDLFRLFNSLISTSRPPVPHSRVGWHMGSFQ